MTNLKTNIISIVLIFFVILIYAQNDKATFIEVLNNNGSASLKKIVFVDKDGFLWYSTSNGIVKEMGLERIVFNFNTSKGFSEVISTHRIFESSDHKIWATTTHGIFCLDVKNNSTNFYRAKYPDTRELVPFYGIIEDPKTNVMYFGSYKNYIYKLKKNKLIPIKISNDIYEDKVTGLSNIDLSIINNKIIVQQQHMWSVLNHEKIDVFFNHENVNSSRKYSYQVIPNGLFLESNASGFYTFNNERFAFFYVKSKDFQIIQLPKNKNISFSYSKNFEPEIIGIDGNELTNYKLKNKILTENHSHHTKKYISNYVLDSNGVLYYHTSSGVFRLNDIQFNFSTALNDSKELGLNRDVSCRSIVESANGTIYMYTYSGVFFKEKNSKSWINLNTKLKNKINFKVLSGSSGLILVNDKFILIYGYGKNYSKINLSTWTKKDFTLDIDNVNYMLQLNEEELLVASKNGLYKYNFTTNNTSRFLNIKSTVTYLKQHDKKLYIGTTKDGLFVFNKITKNLKQYTTTTQPTPLVSNDINHIHIDENENLWLSTRQGLQKINFKTNKFSIFTRNKGFVNDNIVSLLEGENYLWASTFDGLVRIHKKTNHIKTFFEEDGISHNEFNYWSSLKSSDSTFYFGGLNGLTIFKDNSFSNIDVPYDLFLVKYTYYDKESKKKIKVDNLNYNTPSFKIPYNNNFIELKFAINNVANIKKNFYQYKIEEIHTNWVDLGNYNTIQLVGLQPNNYTLKVRGFTSEGDETSTKTYQIKIDKVFYKKTWFILACLLLISSVIYILNSYRNKQLKLKYKQNQTISHLESKAMRAQMNPHFIFNTLNSMQSVMILKGEREANKYFTLFSRLIRLTLDMNNTEMVFIKDEINYLKSYLELENLRLNNNLNYTINVVNDLDIHNNRIPCLMLQPIVENSLLHGLTPKKTDLLLTINFKDNYDIVVVEVIDNGIGREASEKLKQKSTKSHQSWATHIMNERISIFNDLNKQQILFKIIDLKDEQNNSLGTKVILEIPKHIEPKKKLSING